MDSNYETWLAPLRVLLLRKMVLVQITKDVSTGIVGMRTEVPMPSGRASQDGVSDFCTGPTIR